MPARAFKLLLLHFYKGSAETQNGACGLILGCASAIGLFGTTGPWAKPGCGTSPVPLTVLAGLI